MRKLSADIIYPVHTNPIHKGVLMIDEEGEILDVHTNDEGLEDVEYFEGSLCPGFVNAHCHLELSHLRGFIPEKTGIVDFVLELQKIRNFPAEEIQEAIEKAEAEMISNGIVAVGDISNSAITSHQKAKKNLFYHTFVEILGFNPVNAGTIMEKGIATATAFNGLPVSITPHSPYSVSLELMKMIAERDEKIYSIHNQESREENKFTQTKTGDFLKLYKTFNINIDHYEAYGTPSLESYLPFFEKKKMLLVHNTFTSEEEIENASNPYVYWCLCPNANKYIENTLPDIPQMAGLVKDRITIGTDSLASNRELNIGSEIKTILNRYPSLPVAELIKWATLNGARFLNIDKQFGSFEKGKKPGVTLFDKDFKVKKIV